MLDNFNIQNKCHTLSNDGHFLMLEIEYIPVTHTPTNVLHFGGGVEQLRTIQNMGMVHGDIRNVNIVFNDDAGCSHIIDFDLAKNENDVYPSVLYVTHPERHHGACQELKIHNKHALCTRSVIFENLPNRPYETSNLSQKIFL